MEMISNFEMYVAIRNSFVFLFWFIVFSEVTSH